MKKKKTNEPEIQSVTIRLPIELWKKLGYMKADRKIRSIQQTVVDALEKIVKDT